ncbi:MAG: HPr family phosphocarrier protein [Eubacteriales bacterium]|nr:HPr family phosphocarrier protein [Eubacteriales bacterium]
MIKGKAIISDHAGIHARPAANIAILVKNSESDVVFHINGNEVDPGNYIKLMSLNAKCGDEVDIIVEGSDENKVLAELIAILQNE